MCRPVLSYPEFGPVVADPVFGAVGASFPPRVPPRHHYKRLRLLNSIPTFPGFRKLL